MCAFRVREILQIKNAPFVLTVELRVEFMLCPVPQWNIKASSHIKLDPYIIGCVLQVRGEVQYFIKPLSAARRVQNR